MSHAATKWAFDQPEEYRDMKPSEWAVLMVLADCHNPVHGCFPSQDYICSKTNLSDRSVRDQLAKLRERNLVAWEVGREDGRRGSNRYQLAFEGDFQPANPAASQPEEFAGSSTGKIEGDQPANFDQSNRQEIPTNRVIEPVTEPRIEREARAKEPEPDPETDQDFQSLRAKIAKVRGPQTTGRPFPLWAKLSPDDRLKALNGWETCLAAWSAGGQKHAYGLETYLRDRLWEQAPQQAGDDVPKVMLALRSGEWFACFWARWIAGDLATCQKMLRLAKAGAGWPCPAADAPSPDAYNAMPRIKFDSDEWAAWRRRLSEDDLRMNEQMVPVFVWVPSEWPQGDLKTARTG